MAFITKNSIAEVNNRLDAVSIVGDYVRLEKKSGRWWGKCPFHAGGQEKTPSFKVDPELKTYHCFGCNKGGSIISFIMEMDSLTYPEAIKAIAKKTGVELAYEDSYDSSSGEYKIEDTTFKEQMYELYSRTTLTFTHFLTEKPEGKKALSYLKERGISEKMIEVFKLGYAPDDRNFLYGFLRKKGYSEEFLEKSGLFLKNYKTLPLFSSRIMFPITDRQGRIAAFGARAMPGTVQNDGNMPPKYINSPETDIYKKGQTLYGIDIAKPEMRKTKTAVLAEGNIDVIALHEAGISNAVAPLGTAFTDEQASWLSRWADKAILIFDNDEAGHKAAFKAILTCRKNGILCSIADLLKTAKDSKYKDPADILENLGPEVLKNVTKFIIFDYEYLLSLTADKTRINQYLFPYLDVLDSEIGRDDCIARIADYFRIDKKLVQTDYKNWKRDRNRETKNTENILQGKLKPLRRNYELVTLTVAAVNTELYHEFRANVQINEIDDIAAKELFICLEECYVHRETGIDSLLARIKDESLKYFIVSNGGSKEFKGSNARDLLEDGIRKFKIKKLEKEKIELKAEMRQKEREEGNDADSSELLQDILRIDKKIKELKEKRLC